LQIKGDLYEAVIKELAGLISDTELHLTHLAIQLCETIVRHAPETIPLMQSQILPRTTVLLQSSLLQGTALSSSKKLFSTLASAGDKSGCSFASLLDQLMGIVYNNKVRFSRLQPVCSTNIVLTDRVSIPL